MHVSRVLESKGREVATVAPQATLDEAVRMLTKRRIGALVVVAGRGTIAGILSERDIVRALARDGAGALARAVEDYMTRDVATCSQADTIEEVMEVMTRGRFRHLPVVEEGRLAGIVSIGDAVKLRIEETTREAEALKSYIAAG